jgi:hypothetical protein
MLVGDSSVWRLDGLTVGCQMLSAAVDHAICCYLMYRQSPSSHKLKRILFLAKKTFAGRKSCPEQPMYFVALNTWSVSWTIY